MNQYTIQYYAAIRELTGRDGEVFHSQKNSPVEIYQELAGKYKFPFHREGLKVAVNDSFADWNVSLQSGDKLVFMTPVAGG